MPVALQPVRTGPAARILLRAYLIGKTGAGRRRPPGAEMLSAGKRGATGGRETAMKREKASSLPAAQFLP
jgi:hypothetical protein